MRILKTTPVSNDFDSRRDAWSRTYLYRFAVCKEKLPPKMKPNIYRNQMFIPIEEISRCFFVLWVDKLKLFQTDASRDSNSHDSILFDVFCRNEDFQIERLKEAAKLLEGIHDFRTFMKVSKEQRTFKTRFCFRKINSIKVQPGVTLATSFNREKTLALYDFWDIEFVSKAYFYRQVSTRSSRMHNEVQSE